MVRFPLRRERLTVISTCGLTRLIALGWFVGFAVATLVGNSTTGWVVAPVAIAVAIGIQRARGGGRSCPVPAPPSHEQAPGRTADETPRLPSR